jgi:hypothetical protein
VALKLQGIAPLSSSHLLFANDLILFTKATSSQANSLKVVLDQFCTWFGQAINPSKSSIHFSRNTDSSVIHSICGILPFKRALSSAKYLGLPFLFSKSKSADFKDILDKVSGKIEGWRAKTLSQAGRTVLIKSVASTIPAYAMSSFLLPSSISTLLDKMFKKFWWGFPVNKSQNLTLKSWSSICTPKHTGGLGFKKMHDFNLALIAKLGWKLLTKTDCLWVHQLHGKYIKYGDFFSSPAPSTASWLWKGIQKIKPIISTGACLRVSRLSTSSIWTSNLIPTIPSFKPKPKFPLNRNFPSLQIMDLINPDSLSWKVSSIHALFDSTSSSEILKLHISTDPISQFIWTPSTFGSFSTSSVYSLITSSSPTSSSVSSPFWKSI